MKLISSQKHARELSRQLREGSGKHLSNRRSIAALSLAAAGAMGLISLYQIGLIRHLPEPPLPLLDADEVDASPEAYEKLETPDAVVGLASYGATVILATMGGRDRAREKPWIPLALAGKVMFDAVNAAKLTVDQWTRHRSFCFWCLLGAGATFAMVPLVIGEAREALAALDE
ncbi:MAG: vitamin K epoxide reductase family protein [Thermoanaerobaculia bacterium]|nr:vitamin K epoxide reductase family protein [Thermoanaerobaculia bacterium]